MSSWGVVHVPMHRAGRVIGLGDVVDLIEAPALRWVITEIEAIAEPRSSLNLLELEHRVRESEGGLGFTHASLLELAMNLAQVIECEIHGYRADPSHSFDVVVVLRALDSTEWVISLNETVVRLGPDHPLLRGQ
jgi:hypothetical protein